MGDSANIMRKTLLAISIAIALGLTACGQSDRGSQSKVTVTTTADQAAAMKAAQEQVAKCIPEGNIITKDGRQKIMDCIAPPAQQQALKVCVLNAAAKANLATRAGRKQWRDEDLPRCIVQTQKGK